MPRVLQPGARWHQSIINHRCRDSKKRSNLQVLVEMDQSGLRECGGLQPGPGLYQRKKYVLVSTGDHMIQ